MVPHGNASPSTSFCRWLFRVTANLHLPERPMEREQSRLAMARIAVGLIVLWRTALIAISARDYFPLATPDVAARPVGTEVILAVAQCALAVLLTIGCATPVTCLLLLLTYSQCDRVLGTSTLGTNIFTILLGMLFLLNAGARYSVDAWLLKCTSLPSRILHRLYSVFGNASPEYMWCIYLLGFFAYGVLSFFALVFHVQDSYWVGGRTVEVMLTNTYLCRYPYVFRAFLVEYPDVMHCLSCAGVIGQSCFQLLMIPLLRWKKGYWFVLIWGLQFFVWSAFVLQLSYLPWLEFVLWWLILWPCRTRRVCEFIVRVPDCGPLQSVIVTYGCGILFTFCLWTTFSTASGVSSSLVRALYYSHGLDVPNVFNATDLQMGNVWPVVWRRTEGHDWLVPFHTEDGRKGDYLQSDVLYFGNSLRWRRMLIGQAAIEMNASGTVGHELLRRVCQFDCRRNGLNERASYRVDIRTSQQGNVAILPSLRFQSENIGSIEITVAP